MSVLGLSGPPPPPRPVVSPRDKSDHKIIATIIACVVLLVVGSVGGVMGYWIHFSKKYGHIDRSRETLSLNLDKLQNVSTTYSNPPYGVSLTLPGNWRRVNVPNQSFVGLADGTGVTPHFNVLFQPTFTGFPIPTDKEANVLAARTATILGARLQRTDHTTINGREAAILRFANDARKESFNVVVVDKGPVAYTLIILGPTAATDRWQYLDAMLPQSIKLD
jgi:hypothetical protein